MNVTTTDKPVNPHQLQQELGGVDLVVRHFDGGAEVEADTDQQTLDGAVAAHVADDTIQPTDPDREAFRAAVEKAGSIADLKAALLGTTGPGAEARRPTR